MVKVTRHQKLPLTRKALGERRPPPSILIQHNTVVPFKAMLTKISK